MAVTRPALADLMAQRRLAVLPNERRARLEYVRGRVRGGGGMHGGKGGMHGGKGGMMGMVASDANAVDIEGGARLELRPRDPNQLDELRAHARTLARAKAGLGPIDMLIGRNVCIARPRACMRVVDG